MEQVKKSFIEILTKFYGMYSGRFIAFIILMAILEQMWLGADTIGILFVAFTVLVYAGIGCLSRTMHVEAYYVAGRQVPVLFNGMATAAGINFGGHGYLAFVVGWTGGYVLVPSLMSAYLRKFGCYTVPDFIGTAVNLVAMIVVSLATEELDEATQKIVDKVRIARGETVLAASH